HDVAGGGLRYFEALEAQQLEDLQDAAAAAASVRREDRDGRVGADAAAGDAADADDPDVRVVIERAHLELERPFRVHLRRRHELHDGLEERCHVRRDVLEVAAAAAFPGGGV